MKNAAGIIFTDGKTILLLRRSGKDDHYAGYWGIPGGKSKERETFLDTAKRETKEETGNCPNGINLAVFKNTTEEFIFKSFLFLIKKPYIVKISKEHNDSAWVPINKIKNYKLHPKFKKILPDILRKIEEKIDLREFSINNSMDNKAFKLWEVQKYFHSIMNENDNNPTNPEEIWQGNIPSFQSFMNMIADELELPKPLPPATDKALRNILIRLTPEPLGRGGMILLHWFETIIHSVIDYHEQKHGKIIEHAPEIRQARNPVQLIRTLKTLMPHELFNQKAYPEGSLGSSDPHKNDAYFMHQSSLAHDRISARFTPLPPPSPPAVEPPTDGKKKGKKKKEVIPDTELPDTEETPPTSPSGPFTGPMEDEGTGVLTVDAVMLAMPNSVFFNDKKLKSQAEIIHMANEIAGNIGQSVSWGPSDVARILLKKKLLEKKP